MTSPAPEPRHDPLSPIPAGRWRLGRTIRGLVAIPWRGWRNVLLGTWREISSDRIGLVAAGCAFWATLALFPAISMLISFYGLLFDPASVEPQLEVLRDLLPAAAFSRTGAARWASRC